MTSLPDPISGPPLRRGLGLWLTTFYGLGVVVGAGIYVLIGALAGVAGTHAPVSFLIAGIVAGITALSYMELTSRLPEAAGEVAYVDQGFARPALTLAVGVAIVIVATLVSATLSVGAAGYLQTLVGLPGWILVAAIVVVLGGFAIWGIVESATFAAVLTLIEIGGLLLVVGGAVYADPALVDRVGAVVPPPSWSVWPGIFAGAVIAFFAFLGFEDMVNVAEEVDEAETTMPRAIALVLAMSIGFYLIVATVCVLAVPIADLAASPAPLALVVGTALPGAGLLVTLIAIVAALNGILVQFILAARVLYGLAKRGRISAWFGRVDRRTRTPVNATLCVLATVFVLAISLPIAELAAASSRLILAIFILVNLALIRIKRRGGPPAPVSVPIAVPVLGALTSAALLAVSFYV